MHSGEKPFERPTLLAILDVLRDAVGDVLAERAFVCRLEQAISHPKEPQVQLAAIVPLERFLRVSLPVVDRRVQEVRDVLLRHAASGKLDDLLCDRLAPLMRLPSRFRGRDDLLCHAARINRILGIFQ